MMILTLYNQERLEVGGSGSKSYHKKKTHNIKLIANKEAPDSTLNG